YLSSSSLRLVRFTEANLAVFCDAVVVGLSVLHVPNIPLVVVDDKVRGNSAPDGEQTGTGLFPVTTYSSAGGVACSTPGSQIISRVRLLASYAMQCEANEVGRP